MSVVFEVTCTDICYSAKRLAFPLRPAKMGAGSGNGGSTKIEQDIRGRQVHDERYHKGLWVLVLLEILIQDHLAFRGTNLSVLRSSRPYVARTNLSFLGRQYPRS